MVARWAPRVSGELTGSAGLRGVGDLGIEQDPHRSVDTARRLRRGFEDGSAPIEVLNSGLR